MKDSDTQGMKVWTINIDKKKSIKPTLFNLNSWGPGVEITKYSAFSLDKFVKDLPVRHHFLHVLESKLSKKFEISVFPLEKYLTFLPINLYFYLSRIAGQSVISIPAWGLV